MDEIANLLESIGMNYMVEIGGEIRTAGSKLGYPWKIAIEVPKDGRHIFSVIKLENSALATSGIAETIGKESGKRLSHLIDPKTGRPITHKLASVSVIADSSTKSDAWATALMVLGETEGMKIAKKHDLKVYMIVRSANDFKECYDKRF